MSTWSLIGPSHGPVAVVLGGISADHRVTDTAAGRGWWSKVVAAGRTLDPARWRIVGMSYVDAGPSGASPTTFDQADALTRVLELSGIRRVDLLIGASYGAMVGLAFAAHHGERLKQLIAISGGDRTHPYATALRSVQRRIVRLGLKARHPQAALAAARALAVVSHRAPEELGARFEGSVRLEDGRARAPIDDWLDCHGEKFSARMTPERFLALSESLDLHRVEPESIRVPTTLVGVRSDALVPIEDLRRLAKRLPAGRLVELDSPYGHDAFLKEPNAVEAIVAEAHCPREAAA